MTILEAGTSAADLRIVQGATTSENTVNFDTNYVNAAVLLSSNGQAGWTHKWAPMTAGCFSVTIAMGSGTIRSVPLFALLDDSDAQVLRIVQDTSPMVKLQVFVGGVWTDVGSPTTRRTALTRYTFAWDFSVSGSIAWYADSEEVGITTGDFSALQPIASAFFDKWPDSSAQTTVYSEWVAHTQFSLTVRYHFKPPTADGAHTDFTGGYADIDEAGINYLDGITSDTAGDVSTFKRAARTFSIPNKVLASTLVFYGRRGETGPTKLQGVLRQGGVDYDFGDEVEMPYGITRHVSIEHDNPATGVGWTISDANDANLEYGFKSVA